MCNCRLENVGHFGSVSVYWLRSQMPLSLPSASRHDTILHQYDFVLLDIDHIK